MGYAKLIFLAIRLKRKLAACCEIYLHCQCFKTLSKFVGRNVHTSLGGLGGLKRHESENRDAAHEIINSTQQSC